MDIVYIRMKKNLNVSHLQKIYLKDIAHIATTSFNQKTLENTPIYNITKADRDIVVIDSFLVIEHLNQAYDNLEFQLIGPTYTVIRVTTNKHQLSVLMATFVWLLLFIGAAMTIMNFHNDVGMQEVQQKLHYLLTGENNKHPLWMQIPYSLGLGLGMLLFFNHWFKKRFNEEPSPLEIELFKYQKDIDHYISYYENKMEDS